MEPSLAVAQAETLSVERAALERQGFLVLPKLFLPELIRELYAAFVSEYPAYLTAEETPADALIVGHRRLQITVALKGVFNNPQLYANPAVLELVTAALGEAPVISDVSCVTSLPGAQDMHIHCDGRIFNGLPIANLLPPHAIGLLIPLIPFNRQNGVTRLWPGSHRLPGGGTDYQHNTAFVDPELELGDCMLMDYRLMHRGNANNSNDVRPLLYFNYAAPWYFDGNNFVKQMHLQMPDAEFRKVPGQWQSLFARRNLLMASALRPAPASHA